MFILKKHFALYMERLDYEFAAMFVKFVCITYFASQICINLTRDTFLVSFHEEIKADKVCNFLETTMYEYSIFWINIVLRINLVFSSVLFWLEVMPGRLR